MQLIAKLF